jgi:hypothetical protein
VKSIKWLFTAGFLMTSIYHLVAVLNPTSGDGSSPERHLVFVFITLIAAIILYLDRPKSLLIFIPLILQQIYGHGTFGWSEWTQFQRIDWPSVIVLIAMPVFAWYIFRRLYKN